MGGGGRAGAPGKDYADHKGKGGKSWSNRFILMIMLMGSQCMHMSKLTELCTLNYLVFICQLYFPKAIFKR